MIKEIQWKNNDKVALYFDYHVMCSREWGVSPLVYMEGLLSAVPTHSKYHTASRKIRGTSLLQKVKLNAVKMSESQQYYGE